MYVYKKSDKNRENRINLSDGVRFKSLWNKVERIELELRDFTLMNLKFSGEDEETKREIYKAIDCLKSFRHNLKLKSNMVTK